MQRYIIYYFATIFHVTKSYCITYIKGGTDSPTFWGRDLGFVRVYVQEAGGGTRGFTKADNGAKGGATGGWDLTAGVRVEGS